MLVTLGSGQTISAGSSQTYQYACNSAQQVLIQTEESGAGTPSSNFFITIQIGNDVVCNDISFHALGLLSSITGGGSEGNADATFKVDLGSHILDGEENLYVTLRNNHASGDLNATDISAIVNEGGVYEPLKYTNYNDSVFTDTNTLSIYAWADQDLGEDDSVFTIRNQAYSSAPQVLSGITVSRTNCFADFAAGHQAWKYIATMAHNQVPMNTSVNYSSATVDGVICVSAMDKSPSKARASAQSGRAVLSGMTSSERKAL